MSNISQFIDSIKNQKGIKGTLKRKLFGWLFAGLEAADRDIANVQTSDELRKDFEAACVNLRNNNTLQCSTARESSISYGCNTSRKNKGLQLSMKTEIRHSFTIDV